MKAYTDYPIIELGDVVGEEAPIRQVEVVYYDQNKRCKVIVEGVETFIKLGYLYQNYGRCDDVETINSRKCKDSYGRYPSSKAAQITVSWLVYPPNYKQDGNYKSFSNLGKAWRSACNMGIGASVVQQMEVKYKDGSASWTSGDVIFDVTSKEEIKACTKKVKFTYN